MQPLLALAARAEALGFDFGLGRKFGAGAPAA